MKSITRFSVFSSIISLQSLVWAAPSPPTGGSSTDPVCIIGAGPAGLVAANSLEAKGRRAIIFEKQPEVGGKCQAFYENRQYHPLGALLYSNLTYLETVPIINSVNVPSVPFESTGQGPNYIFNPVTGATVLRPPPPIDFTIKMVAEIARYSTWWAFNFWPKFGGVGYKNPIPQEFTVSTKEWLQKNNYETLDDVFLLGMIAYGYGDIADTPILYMLQYFTPDILTFFAKFHKGYLIDFHQVFVQYARKSVKSPIRLNSRISRIDRSSGRPVITYSTTTSPTSTRQACSELILAFPPTVENLRNANLDITAAERTLFTPLKTTNYYSSAVRVATPDDFTFSIASNPGEAPPAVGQPVAFLRLFDNSNIATCWSWDSPTSTRTPAQIRTILKDTLSKFNKDPRDPNAQPKPVTDADVLAFRKWDYFPHLGTADLAGGWYQRFNRQQGVGRTYYASGLNGFETVEFAIRAGKDVVKSFF